MVIFIASAFVLCLVGGSVYLLFLKVERESFLPPQETSLRDLFSEVDALIPPAEKLASYSIVMADARHKLRAADDTDEFFAALEQIVEGLPGFYQTLGDLESLQWNEKALENLSRLFS